MRNFIIGLIIGLILGGGVSFAASRFGVVDDKGNLIGTAANPMYITFQ